MSVLGRILRGREQRSTLATPSEWLLSAFGIDRNYSGESVTLDTVMGLAPYYRGVQLLSGSVGMLPCKVYQPTPDGGRREVTRGSRPWVLLHEIANQDIGLAANEWWAIVESHIDTWGNHFSWKERAEDGRVLNLWPVDPSRVQVGIKDHKRVFTIDGQGGYTDFDILHFRGLSIDGVVGYSPIQLHRHSLGAELARRKFQGRFWKNDATPGITLIHPNKLQPDAIDRIKAKWEEHHKGAANARKVAVLGEDMKIQQMTMPLQDAQFIEQAKYGATEQALILGIPPHMVGGDVGGSMTYSTVEGQSVDFLKWSLNPRLVRLAKTVTNDGDIMPRPWYAEFETGAILRTTTKERFEAYALADWMTLDEIRAKENMEPLPDGAGSVLSQAASPTINVATGGEPASGDGQSSLPGAEVVPIARRLGR